MQAGLSLVVFEIAVESWSFLNPTFLGIAPARNIHRCSSDMPDHYTVLLVSLQQNKMS